MLQACWQQSSLAAKDGRSRQRVTVICHAGVNHAAPPAAINQPPMVNGYAYRQVTNNNASR